MLTIKGRIVAGFLLAFGLVLVGVATLIYQSSIGYDIDQLDIRLASHADKVATEVEEEVSQRNFPDTTDISALVTNGLHDLRLQIFDPQGRPLLGNPRNRQLDSFVMPLLHRQSVRTTSPHYHEIAIGERSFRVAIVPIDVEGMQGLNLAVAVPLDDLHGDANRLLLLLVVTVPTALLISGLLAWLILRAGFRPVSTMIDSSNRITMSSLDGRIPVRASRDELQALALTLNRMIERIETGVRSQKQFVADASHEYRTPLTIMRAELEYAEPRADLPEVRESIQIAIAEVDRLAALTRSLLTLVRLDGPQEVLRTPVSLGEILTDCLRRADTLARNKNLELHVDLQRDVVIHGDAEGIERAILNLVENALKFSEPGGGITVVLDRSNGEAVLHVRDRGPGIDPADIPHIFDRFFRASAMRGSSAGHGLGLAITKRIVELHGGTVSVRNRNEGGAEFEVRLPAA